ncbi:MAG: FecR domain-containing protein [bacterium]
MMSNNACVSRMLRYVAGILFVFMMAMSVKAEDNSADKAIGAVTYVRGKVSIVNSAGAERVALVKAAIFLNEKISCGAGSKMEVRFIDDSVLSVGEQSEMVVDQYIYSPDAGKDVSFVMRMLKGACRLTTGAITKLNPDRFKVRTRLATVGIRGCELGIVCKPEKDDVYVIRLGKEESVVIDTTVNGNPVMDMATGQALEIDAATRKVVNVNRSSSVVTVVAGKGFVQREFNVGEMDELTKGTSHMPAARYDTVYTSDAAVIQLKPMHAAEKAKEGDTK